MADAKERKVEEEILTTSRKVLNFIDTAQTELSENVTIFVENGSSENCCEKTENSRIQTLVMVNKSNDISLPVSNINCSDCLNNSKVLINETEYLSTCEESQDLSFHNEGDKCKISMEQMSESQSSVKNLENTEGSIEMTQHLRCQVNFADIPAQVTGSWKDFEGSPENFLKGCKWSPDGTCILTCSNDNILRLFNLPNELYSDFDHCGILPEMSSVLRMREGETIYDYSWYPNMSSYNPDTCCFISSSRDHPLHLWDAFTGQIRCSYRAYSHMDEIVSPHCTAFNLEGSKIYCGFNKMVRVFDTSRPGRQCQQRPTVSKKQGQFGIISCIAISPENNGIYACGSFSKAVGIYGEPKGTLLSLVEGHQGGLTHVVFSLDGHRLYSGGRKDNEIICWDVRYPGNILHKLKRYVNTNQRMYFDIDSSGKYIVSGNHDGTVSVWDTSASCDVILPCHMTFVAHDDCVNGISFHPSLPYLATASGQRTFILQDECENDDKDETIKSDNSLRLWKLICNNQET